MNPIRRTHHQRPRQRAFMALFIVIGIALLFFGRFIIDAIRYSPVALQLVTHNSIDLQKTEDNKINILILGTGGGTHEGPNLTDTIIFASLDSDSSSATATLVSIPRDLWIEDLKSKINKAYSDGERKAVGGGLTLAKAVVGRVINQKIDYAVRIDFSGFIKAVDQVGGLDVEVERTLDDYAYPVEGKEEETCGVPEEDVQKIATDSAKTDLEKFPCRYEHLHVDKGMNHMDGTLALKYVRSRHGLGAEGSDFARSKRQEKVIAAFKEKVFSLGTILNPIKVSQLYEILKDSIDTDIQQDEYDDFIRLAEKMKDGTIKNYVIDAGDIAVGRPALLYSPYDEGEDISPYYGAWALVPTAGNGNYSQIQDYVTCLTQQKKCDQFKPSPTPTKSPSNR